MLLNYLLDLSATLECYLNDRACMILKACDHKHLVQPLRWRHRCLDRQATYVLPRLLQQTNQIIDSQHDVRDQLILGHAHITNGDTQAEHLLQLKLDCRLDFGDLVGEIFVVRDWGREFAGCERCQCG